MLDVFLTNCPHLWKQTSAFKSLVRSDHLSILVIPRIVVNVLLMREEVVIIPARGCGGILSI